MARVTTIVTQVVITFVLVAILVPSILVNVPAARGGVAGPTVVALLAVLLFVILRLVWPKRWK